MYSGVQLERDASTQELLKWGHFDRAKSIFKMPLVSWTETESTDEV